MGPFAALIIACFLIAVYIVWNCNVKKSLVVLIVLLGLVLYVQVAIGTEEFAEGEEDSQELGTVLGNVGVKKTSVFSCTSAIGDDEMKAAGVLSI